MRRSSNIPVLRCVEEFLAKFPAKPTVAAEPLKREKVKPVYTEATELEAAAVEAVSMVRIPPYTWDRLFGSRLQPGQKLTESQRKHLWRIAYKYRRQIKSQRVVEEACRLGKAE